MNRRERREAKRNERAPARKVAKGEPIVSYYVEQIVTDLDLMLDDLRLEEYGARAQRDLIADCDVRGFEIWPATMRVKVTGPDPEGSYLIRAEVDSRAPDFYEVPLA